MKKYIIFIIIPFILSGCLLSLDKEGISNTTLYKGRVIDGSGSPLKEIPVRITNGKLIFNSTYTGADGTFQIEVDITKIDNTYYIAIGEEDIKAIKLSLKGFGQDVYDYGDIPFVDIKLPVVHTDELLGVTKNSFTCKCNVKSQGASPVEERGLCWGTSIPTVNNHKVPFGNGEGYYTCTVSDESINVEATTYYARAYARNSYDVAYGEAIEINASRLAYFSLPTMEYGGFTYYIYPDMGGMTWEQGVAACQNLSAYEFGDWFLPNKEELYAVAQSTNILDVNNSYWSSEAYNGANAFALYYYQGAWKLTGGAGVAKTNIYHVIPVRKVSGGSYFGAVQEISGESDCVSCNGWTWSGGVATIGRSGDGGAFNYKERSFSFVAKRSGNVTLEFKINAPNYSSWVCLWCDDKAAGTIYAKSGEFSKVSIGHVDASQLVYICGTNVVIGNVKVE